MTQQYPEPTVGALILNKESKILLVKSHKWQNNYVIPGGHVELGETLQDTLKREIKEETGYLHDITKELGTLPGNSFKEYSDKHLIEGATIYIGTINNIYKKFSQHENEEDNNFIYSRINTVCSYTDRDEYSGIKYTVNVEYLGKFLSYSSNQTPSRSWYNEAIWNLTHTNSLNYPFPYKGKDNFLSLIHISEPTRPY